MRNAEKGIVEFLIFIISAFRIPTSTRLSSSQAEFHKPYNYQPQYQLAASSFQFYIPIIQSDPARGLIQGKSDGLGEQGIIDHAP